MSDLTIQMNASSIDYVQEEISRKKSATPFIASGKSVTHTVTDYDHHPYTRWFRGVYYYPDPIIAEREAGWRKIEEPCYKPIYEVNEEPFQACFQPVCSTVLPCFPVEKDYENEKRVNRLCLVQYR